MNTIKLATVILLWLVVLWRLPAAIRKARQRAMWTAFLGLAAAATTSIPAVGVSIDTVLGAHNASVLVKHILGIVAIAAVLEFVIAMSRPQLLERSRPYNVAVGIVVAATMTGLFCAVGQPTRVANFYEAYRDSLPALGYSLTFVLYLAAAMFAASWMCVTAARLAARTWLRAGLWLLGVGTGVGTVYGLLRATHLVYQMLDATFPMEEDEFQPLADAVQYLAILLIILGNAVAPVDVLRSARHDWQAARRLRPLWRELTTAAPDVVLAAPLGRNPRIQLHRVVIEIRDAASALDPYVPEALRDPHADAARQAAGLFAARQSKLGGHHPDGSDAGHFTINETATELDELDFDAEVQRLTALADAYQAVSAPIPTRTTR
ncbi:MAB_1171c family putative transporter [Streptomyces sp. NPDC059999]|uniref:MAB_1171c family putative transporter n=1 Tax=Streptomyces sp. NPDC059999 TaxID=3347030 RepID=UPI0036937E78